jgi:thioesterase domain-containing protein/acyl carrier protein
LSEIALDLAVLAKVQKAWLQALGVEQCDFTKSWEHAGGDSLATLHLMLRIERAFGCKLSYDMLQPDMRVHELAALLLRTPAEPAEPAETLPLVHLLPSLFGDEPRLAKFRQALAGRIRFNIVAPPDAMQPAAILRDIRRIAALAARDIEAHQPNGAIMLAGYSFGACVAYEAAQALMAAGRDVTLLAILDGPFGRAAVGMTITMRHWPKEIKHALALWGCSWDAGRRAMLLLLQRLGVSAEIAAKRSVYLAFRKQAVNRWSPAPIGVETLLAVSEELGPRTLAIWQRMCARLRVVHLPGDHVDIFNAPASDRLVPVFEEAVRAAHAGTRSSRRVDDPSRAAQRPLAVL